MTKLISLDVFFVKQCEKLSAGKWVIDRSLLKADVSETATKGNH